MENMRIRNEAKKHGVMLWQIAERYGVNDGNFSRKLRRDMSTDEQDRIIDIIHEIASQKDRAV